MHSFPCQHCKTDTIGLTFADPKPTLWATRFNQVGNSKRGQPQTPFRHFFQLASGLSSAKPMTQVNQPDLSPPGQQTQSSWNAVPPPTQY